MRRLEDEYIYRNFEYFRPDIFKRAVNIQMIDIFELKVELDNGDVVIYDDQTRGVRKLPDDPDNMTDEEWALEFSIRLRTKMHRQCITQEELCELIGISPNMLSRYMTGKAVPSFRVVDKIARVLKCSVDELRYF